MSMCADSVDEVSSWTDTMMAEATRSRKGVDIFEGYFSNLHQRSEAALLR